ncbi:MAG TPA: hypothetical protein VL326_16525 [Kofleriaceae bacterium]|jgi:hypothetical protein|nr:hypothetical protein [Kofleriaceae bacterium]
MLLFRSFALGLLGAIFYLLATRPATVVVREPVPIEVPNLSGIRGVPGPTIIDVARGVDWTVLPSLVHLGEGEHVAMIDDAPVANDLEAGSMLAARWTGHRYVDLEVRGPRGNRRVLMLLH